MGPERRCQNVWPPVLAPRWGGQRERPVRGARISGFPYSGPPVSGPPAGGAKRGARMVGPASFWRP
eukprot:547792-Alexandrium_andersonii.AAC.1